MNKINKDVLSDNEGVSIGKAGSYIQQYKDIEQGKISTAKIPTNFKESKVLNTRYLPEKWEPKSEREILLYYCKKFGCTDFADLEDKSSQIASAVNRSFDVSLTSKMISDKLSKHIKAEDLFQDEEDKPIPKYNKVTLPKKVAEISENTYQYLKGLPPLTSEQLELCQFIDPVNLVFSSDSTGFYLAVAPGKEKSFDNLLKFSPREKMVYEMFREQLNDDHKAKKLVLMSRLLNEDKPLPEKKITKKSKSKKKIVKKSTSDKK